MLIYGKGNTWNIYILNISLNFITKAGNKNFSLALF